MPRTSIPQASPEQMYEHLRERAKSGEIFFRVWTPAPCLSTESLPTRGRLESTRVPHKSPKLSDPVVMGQSIIRHLILDSAERASLRVPAYTALSDDLAEIEDAEYYPSGSGATRHGGRHNGSSRPHEKDEDAMDVDQPLYIPDDDTCPTVRYTSSDAAMALKGSERNPEADHSRIQARAVSHARAALSQLDMPTEPSSLAHSPWAIMTDSLDSAIFMLARALALDRDYQAAIAIASPKLGRRECDGAAGTEPPIRKWYLSVIEKPDMLARINGTAPMIINVSDALRTWEEGMDYGSKRQVVRSHWTSAGLGGLYVCWDGARAGAKEGIGARGGGREGLGLRVIKEWRCTELQFPFPLPPVWLRDDNDHDFVASEYGSSARSIISSTTSTLRSSSRRAPRSMHLLASPQTAGAAWIDKLVLDPLEDNFGEAQDRIRGVSDISPQGGGGLGTSRQWPRKGPSCPW